MVKSRVVSSSEEMEKLLGSFAGDELITMLPYGPPTDYSYLVVYHTEQELEKEKCKATGYNCTHCNPGACNSRKVAE